MKLHRNKRTGTQSNSRVRIIFMCFFCHQIKIVTSKCAFTNDVINVVLVWQWIDGNRSFWSCQSESLRLCAISVPVVRRFSLFWIQPRSRIRYGYLGKSCSFGLPRVPFVNCRQFMYLVISLLVLRAGSDCISSWSLLIFLRQCVMCLGNMVYGRVGQG